MRGKVTLQEIQWRWGRGWVFPLCCLMPLVAALSAVALGLFPGWEYNLLLVLQRDFTQLTELGDPSLPMRDIRRQVPLLPVSDQVQRYVTRMKGLDRHLRRIAGAIFLVAGLNETLTYWAF